MSDYKKHKSYSRDEILAFTDKELIAAANHMRACIRDAHKKNQDPTDLEIEFCYLDNERQKRDKWSSNSSGYKKSQHPKKNYKGQGSDREPTPVKPRAYSNRNR